MKTGLFRKTFEAIDMEQIGDEITAAMKKVRKTEGTVRVSIIHCSVDDCDCTGFRHRHGCQHETECY